MKKMSLFISFAVSCLLCGCSAEKPMDVSGSGVHFDGVVDGVSQKGPFLTGYMPKALEDFYLII